MSRAIWTHESSRVSSELLDDDADDGGLRLRLVDGTGAVETDLEPSEAADLLEAIGRWLTSNGWAV